MPTNPTNEPLKKFNNSLFLLLLLFNFFKFQFLIQKKNKEMAYMHEYHAQSAYTCTLKFAQINNCDGGRYVCMPCDAMYTTRAMAYTRVYVRACMHGCMLMYVIPEFFFFFNFFNFCSNFQNLIIYVPTIVDIFWTHYHNW